MYNCIYIPYGLVSIYCYAAVTGKLWPKMYQIKLHPNTKPLRVPLKEMCLRGPDDYVKV